MSEDIKKNEQDAELNLDDLGKVAGGDWVDIEVCPKCGSRNLIHTRSDLGQDTAICQDCGEFIY